MSPRPKTGAPKRISLKAHAARANAASLENIKLRLNASEAADDEWKRRAEASEQLLKSANDTVAATAPLLAAAQSEIDRQSAARAAAEAERDAARAELAALRIQFAELRQVAEEFAGEADFRLELVDRHERTIAALAAKLGDAEHYRLQREEVDAQNRADYVLDARITQRRAYAEDESRVPEPPGDA